jgi:predicted acylesterase/phospholipase RssA
MSGYGNSGSPEVKYGGGNNLAGVNKTASGVKPRQAANVGAKLRPQQVKFISFEGGGVAGFAIHPGVVRGLESLKIITQKDYKQTSIESFAGSSSGSWVATLSSVGYTGDEIAQLLHPKAFDMIFRLEELQLGLDLDLMGKKLSRVITKSQPKTINFSTLLSDLLGGFLDAGMLCQWLLNTPLGIALSKDMVSLLTLRSLDLEKIKIDLLSDLNKQLHQILKDKSDLLAEVHKYETQNSSNRLFANDFLNEFDIAYQGDFFNVKKDFNDRIEKLENVNPEKTLNKFFKNYYPDVISKLVDHLSTSSNNIENSVHNVLNIIKNDFGLFNGFHWRSYIDCLIAFAAVRVKHPKLIFSLPDHQEMSKTKNIEHLFLTKMNPVSGYFKKYINMSFKTHKSVFALNHDIDPLKITGANILTHESHIFSSGTTPDFPVAHAVRIASGLPPFFKPIHMTSSDIPNDWMNNWAGNIKDRFANYETFLEGYWIDGGTYANSPIDLYIKDETLNRKALGIGNGIQKQTPLSPPQIQNVTDFATHLFNPVYESRIAGTRINLNQFMNVDDLGIAVSSPKMSEEEIKFYNAYGALTAVSFFS